MAAGAGFGKRRVPSRDAPLIPAPGRAGSSALLYFCVIRYIFHPLNCRSGAGPVSRRALTGKSGNTSFAEDLAFFNIGEGNAGLFTASGKCCVSIQKPPRSAYPAPRFPALGVMWFPVYSCMPSSVVITRMPIPVTGLKAQATSLNPEPSVTKLWSYPAKGATGNLSRRGTRPDLKSRVSLDAQDLAGGDALFVGRRVGARVNGYNVVQNVPAVVA